MDNKNELFPVVNEQGDITGSIRRGEAHSGTKVLHPVVHLHVFNSDGELYLQHRPVWKDIQPDRWDTSVGGHVDYSECLDADGTPYFNIASCVTRALQREVREELGIASFVPEHVGSYVFESDREKELVNVFKTIYDGPVTPNTDELDSGRFWSADEILAMMGRGVFTPNFESEYKRFFGSEPE